MTGTEVKKYDPFQDLAFVPDPNVDLTFNVWTGYMEGGFRLHESLPWWLGDLLNLGEAKFGEKYSQAIELTGKSYERLAAYANVAGKVPRENRLLCLNTKLTWTHCQVVSKFGSAEQRKWLELALENSWSTDELKTEVRRSEQVDRPALEPKGPSEVGVGAESAGPERGLDDEVEVHERVPDGEFMGKPIKYEIDADLEGVTVWGPEELLIALATVVEG